MRLPPHDENPRTPSNTPKHKSPTGAGLLSLLLVAGIGQFYAGKPVKGILFLVITGITIFFIEDATMGAAIRILIRIVSAVDAYLDAKRFNEEIDL